LNYISDVWVRSEKGFRLAHEIKDIDRQYISDMGYAIYAEGFHDAIQSMSYLNIPICKFLLFNQDVTANGIADAKDHLKEIYLRRHLHVLANCLSEGFDIQGYMYWSLLDNFEWTEGFTMKYGLFEVDFKTQSRTLRNGAKFYYDVIAEYKRLCFEDSKELEEIKTEEVITIE
jgi:beta-glucosidase